MLYDIDLLIKGIQEHATIDTYVRKLYLTCEEREFKKLKAVLFAFFVWAQLVYKPDGRYETFFGKCARRGKPDDTQRYHPRNVILPILVTISGLSMLVKLE